VALVDLEDLYGPDLAQPDKLPGGSPGYAHKTAPTGLWSADADRFAGAVLLAEMLGWCDARVCQAAFGETYFDPDEMQQESERYLLLQKVIMEHWGTEIMNAFAQTWHSFTLNDCPPLMTWGNLLGISSTTIGMNVVAAPQDQLEATPIAAQEHLVQDKLQSGEAWLEIGDVNRAVAELAEAYQLAPTLAANLYAQALIQRASNKEQTGLLHEALNDCYTALSITHSKRLSGKLERIIANISTNIESQLMAKETQFHTETTNSTPTVTNNEQPAVLTEVNKPRRSRAWIGWGMLIIFIGLLGIAMSVTNNNASGISITPSIPIVQVPLTSTPISTSTLSSIMPTVTSTPAPLPIQNIPIGINSLATDNIQDILPGFPMGEQIFGGVKFIIPTQNNKVSSECTNYPEWPAEFFIPVNLSNPEEVYILLNAGYTGDYEGKNIGRINMNFADGQKWSYNLVLGQNIREWRIYAETTVGTTSSPDLVEVYRGLTNKDDVGVIDMLKIVIPDEYRDRSLQSISIQDTFSGNPCFFFIGITVKGH
jgi:hypothetical protein